jgi:hypothetical protein
MHNGMLDHAGGTFKIIAELYNLAAEGQRRKNCADSRYARYFYTLSGQEKVD